MQGRLNGMNEKFSNPLVQLVDTDGKCIGYSDKLRAHQSGQLHLAFSVLIFRVINNEVEFLLQKRALDKYHSGGLWTNTCCSHPMPKEKIEDAAQRRLLEEIGFASALDFVRLKPFIYFSKLDKNMIEHEYDHILLGRAQSARLAINPDEVSQTKWWNTRKIEIHLKDSPSMFTVWFPEVFHRANAYLRENTHLIDSDASTQPTTYGAQLKQTSR